MTLETLKILRSILLKSFLIGYVLMLVTWAMYFLWRGNWEMLMVDQWHLIDRSTLEIIIVSLYSLAKFYFLFCILVPALAIHWVIKGLEKKA